MIRLIIAVIGVFLIWVLFFSSFNKNRKIIIASVAVFLSLLGVWLESSWQKPQVNIVQNKDVISCGISASYSYRSNFDFQICLRNQAAAGHVKRIKFSITASQCVSAGECQALQSVERELAIELAPQSETAVLQNISFTLVDPALEGISWSFETLSLKAIK